MLRNWLALALSLLFAPAALGQTLAPPFENDYTITNLASVPGVPTNYGGLCLKFDNPNVLLIGGEANSSNGAIYAVNLTRDAGGHISGFSGNATLFATAPNIDGGLSYGPNNVLFYTTYSNNMLGQIKPGSTSPDKIIDLSAAGIASSVGAHGFEPAGFVSPGRMHMLSFSTNRTYTMGLTADGNGTYDLTGVTEQAQLTGGLEGIAWVPGGSPVFVGPSVLVAEWSAGKVGTYQLDANGLPIPGSRQDFLSSLSGAEGAFIDPATGDFLFSTFGGGNQVIRISGFAPVPEPACLLASGGVVLCLTRRLRRRVASRRATSR